MIYPFRIACGTAFLWSVLCVNPAVGSTCMASWYERGSRTANGEHYRPDGLTAAHRTLPFGSILRVTYSGRSVVVRVTDRGPASYTGRCIDLSRGAARALGITSRGIARVTITKIGK